MSRRKSLVITGDRLNGRHLIYIRGRPVWLTTSQFTALCLLVHARFTSTTGYLATSDAMTPVTVHRLRKVLGKRLIQTGGFSEYRLSLAVNAIAVEESFYELPTSLFSERLLEQLKSALHVQRR